MRPDRPHRLRRTVVAASLLLLVVAGLRMAGVTAFAMDRQASRHAVTVGGPGVQHNCLTAYVIGAYKASRGASNVYDPVHYKKPPDPTPIHVQIGDTFTIDHYPYPPPFLLLPRLFLAFSDDFFAIRAGWFLLSLVLFAGALVASVVWSGGFRTNRTLLLVPAVCVAQGTLFMLQMGNVHAMLLGLCVLGMMAFEGRRRSFDLVGGALLGFAIVTKVWPAVLLLYHLCSRRWQPVVWTSAWIAGYGALTLLLFGSGVFADFFSYQLPRLNNGEAFSFMALVDHPLTTNMSVNAIPHKLRYLGLVGEQPLLNPWILWPFTVIALGLIASAGLRRGPGAAACTDDDRLRRMRTWLAVIALCQLRSPFLPWPYGVVATLWLLTMLLPGRAKATVVLLAIAFVVMSLPTASNLTLHAWQSTFGTIVTVVAAVAVLLAPSRPTREALE